MFVSLQQFSQRKLRHVRSERPLEGRRRAFRPRLLALEDRRLLSTLTVTSSADIATQNHTLRYAVAHAQSGDTIQITAAVKDPIVLTNGELVLNHNVTIESVPARTPTISGDGISRVFEISAGAQVSLENLNITGGNGVADNPSGSAGNDGLGGAVLNLGTLSATGVGFLNNTASIGGGAIFTVAKSFTYITEQHRLGQHGHRRRGLWIWWRHLRRRLPGDHGQHDLKQCRARRGRRRPRHERRRGDLGTLFQGNSAAGNGGGFSNHGIFGAHGTMVVSTCTFLGNTAGINGGGFDSTGVVALSGSLLQREFRGQLRRRYRQWRHADSIVGSTIIEQHGGWQRRRHLQLPSRMTPSPASCT